MRHNGRSVERHRHILIERLFPHCPAIIDRGRHAAAYGARAQPWSQQHAPTTALGRGQVHRGEIKRPTVLRCDAGNTGSAVRLLLRPAPDINLPSAGAAENSGAPSSTTIRSGAVCGLPSGSGVFAGRFLVHPARHRRRQRQCQCRCRCQCQRTVVADRRRYGCCSRILIPRATSARSRPNAAPTSRSGAASSVNPKSAMGPA